MTDPAPQDLATLEPLEPIAAAPMDAGGGTSNADAMLQAMRSGLPAPAYNPFCRDVSFYRFLFAGVMMLVGCLMPFTADLDHPGYKTVSGGFYLLIAIALVWSWWASIANNRPVGLKWLLFAAIPLVAISINLASFDPAVAFARATSAGWINDNQNAAPDVAAKYEAAFDVKFGGNRPDVRLGSESELAALVQSSGSKRTPAEVEASLRASAALTTGAWFSASGGWAALGSDMFEGLIRKDNVAAARVEGFWRLFGVGNLFVLFGALLAELGFIGGIVGGFKKNSADKAARLQASAERRRK